MPERIAHSKLWFWLVLCALVIVASLAAAGVAFYSQATQQKSTDRRICAAVNRIDATIVVQLDRAKVTLPTLAYYRQHPRELRDQLAQIEEEKAAFRPRTCS